MTKILAKCGASTDTDLHVYPVRGTCLVEEWWKTPTPEGADAAYILIAPEVSPRMKARLLIENKRSNGKPAMTYPANSAPGSL